MHNTDFSTLCVHNLHLQEIEISCNRSIVWKNYCIGNCVIQVMQWIHRTMHNTVMHGSMDSLTCMPVEPYWHSPIECTKILSPWYLQTVYTPAVSSLSYNHQPLQFYKIICYQLELGNNLPMFQLQLNAPVVIRVKVKKGEQTLLFIPMHYWGLMHYIIGGQRLVRIAPPSLPPHHSSPAPPSLPPHHSGPALPSLPLHLSSPPTRDFQSSISVEALFWGCHLDAQYPQ